MISPSPILKKLLRSSIPIVPKIKAPIAKASYVFVTQYYKNGGAERVINNYISALKALSRDIKIAIIATDDDSGTTWTEGLPKGVQFINLANTSKHLPRYLRIRLLQQVLLRISPRTVHIVNSKVALGLVAKQHTPPYRTYLSLFNSDYSTSGRLRTYYKELRPAAKNLTRIFTDNTTVISEATTATGLPKDLFRAHYQPISLKILPPHTMPQSAPLRILWASRISHQKRPDILREIAKNLSPKSFHISAYGALEPPFTRDYFAGIPTLSYKGPFSSFSALPTKDFDLFLYTSQADGLPNILLEATAAGLPSIAPDVGGVSEIVNEKTGFLIKDFRDVATYTATLQSVASTRPDLAAKIKSAQSLLKSHHCLDNFIKTVKSDIIV